MATVPATITINFTSNYVGCHRLFWRKTPSGAYTGPIEATPPCTGNGDPCSITFTDIVDTEACVPVDYNGYVQACCEDVASPLGRIAWTLTYTPSPTCLPITITCNAVGVAGFTITNPGNGYVGTEDPNVTITGGGGLGATGTINIGTGDLTDIMVNTQGVGPNVPAASYPGVTGTNFTTAVPGVFTVVVNATTLNTGVFTYVNAVTLVSATTTTQWTVGDTFKIDPSAIGNVVGFVAEVTGTDLGQITSITLGTSGSGYTSQPSVTIDSPDGGSPIQATAEAIMGPCPDAFVIGPNCDGDDYSAFPISPELGQAFDLCFQGGAISSGSLPGEYTSAVNATGCCTECVSITIFNGSASSVDLSYLDCNTLSLTKGDVQSITIGAGATEQVCCVVKNSWALTASDSVVITEGTCDCTP